MDILRSQLEWAARGALIEDRRSLLVKLAMDCANLFVSSLPQTIALHRPNGKKISEFSLKPLSAQDDVPYGERYMTMVFRKLICRNCGNRLEADRLQTQYAETLPAILEGLVVETEDGKLSLFDMDEESIEIKNLSSWQDNLCLFTPERALIYFPAKRVYLAGQTGSEAVNVERYWECIARGIEHTILVRAALQILEYESTKRLDTIPALTRKVVDGSVTPGDKTAISEMSQEVANTFTLLRGALTPASSYHASYAIKTFEYLNAVLHMKDIENHVEHNVNELVAFAQFFTGMALEDEINRVGLVIGLVALIIAGPSFLNDFHDFFVQTYGWPRWTEWGFFAIIAALIVTLSTSIIARGARSFRSILRTRESKELP